jgi:DNA-binding NtrC family response regulator
MAGQRYVLVVDADSTDRANTVLLLQSAGYRVVAATAFDEAKQLIATETPDLLVTSLRLGPYNGIHLILRSRMDHPEMAAIVTSRYADAVLKAEAERQHARFVVRPFADSSFLDVVGQSLCVSASADSTPMTMESMTSQDR